MKRIRCTDANGRKFSLMVREDVEVTQEWIDEQNVNRAKFGFGQHTEAIVEWTVETI